MPSRLFLRNGMMPIKMAMETIPLGSSLTRVQLSGANQYRIDTAAPIRIVINTAMQILTGQSQMVQTPCRMIHFSGEILIAMGSVTTEYVIGIQFR